MLPFSWSVGTARQILLWEQAGPAPQPRLATALPLRWPHKRLAAVEDFVLDATELLADATDVLSATVNATDALVLIGQMIQGGRLTLWLAGGAAGRDNLVDLTLTTASTRRVHRIIRLFVRD